MESVYSIALKIHLAIFLLVNLILFLIDFITAGGWWFYWITAVWLIALLFQAFASFQAAKRDRSDSRPKSVTGSKSLSTEMDDDFWKLE